MFEHRQFLARKRKCLALDSDVTSDRIEQDIAGLQRYSESMTRPAQQCLGSGKVIAAAPASAISVIDR